MTKDFVIVSVCIVGLINTSQSSFILFFIAFNNKRTKEIHSTELVGVRHTRNQLSKNTRIIVITQL